MSYDASMIQVISALEAIRRRPVMYVGPLEDPAMFNRLIQEALCVAIDEAASGYCTELQVTVSSEDTITVRDNGRGLSTTPDAYGRVPAETLFTTLYACRDRKENPHLRQSCCGSGIVAVNALSAWFRVRNFREGACWIQEYHQGESLGPFRREAEVTETGLELSFQLDPTIFHQLHFDARRLARWVRGVDVGFGPPRVTRRSGSSETTTLLFRMLDRTP